LCEANWGFVVLQHRLGVGDEVGKILLEGTGDQTDDETFI
jgi:hypothetical protein